MRFNGRSHVTRRRLLALGGAVAAMAMLPGCIQDDDRQASGQSGDDSPVPTPDRGTTSASGTGPPGRATPVPSPEIVDAIDETDIEIARYEGLNDSGHYDEVQVAVDGTPHLIPLDAIEWGGVSRDAIPSLDRPAYVGPDRWDQMVYDPDGLVIGVEANGKRRAYPLQILIWHEIINETFEGEHLLVTY